MNKEEILKITKKFHDTYEKLSKEYDYETRKETRVFDINSSNGKLMYATVNEVIKPILEENQELREKIDKYENPEDMALMMMWCTEKVKDENEKLNKKYENAVADYEKTMFEKEQLKKQLEELKSTNKVLSEELTKDKILKQDCLTTCCGIPIGDIPKLINKQQEFIDYMAKTIEELESDNVDDEEMKGYLIQRIDTFKEILQKYKSIIGDDK